nr:MAG TPA: tail assembly chaperone protein [Bacteriophage sp.]DAM95552.1 MAG TPA: tail assembly chaperone protein [Caudoviricetes sp.]
MLNKNDFLNLHMQKAPARVFITSLNDEVELRALNISELETFIKLTNDEKTKLDAIFYVVSTCCVNPSFTPDELKILNATAFKIIDEIATKILNISQETSALTPR